MAQFPKINDPSTYGDEGENYYGQKYGTKKDQFGFGTEQPISTKDVLEMEQAKIDKLLSLGEINQEEYKRLYEILQQQIDKESKYTLKHLQRDVSNELQDPRFMSNIKGMLTGKSREERAAAHENLDSSKFRTVYGDEGY